MRDVVRHPRRHTNELTSTTDRENRGTPKEEGHADHKCDDKQMVCYVAIGASLSETVREGQRNRGDMEVHAPALRRAP